MSSPHVYDKAKYHYETIEQHGLSVEHTANHTVMFFRWLIERRMMSNFFEQEAKDVLLQFRAGEVSIHKVYEWWDCCLIDEMLSDEGNAFAMHYFDFEGGLISTTISLPCRVGCRRSFTSITLKTITRRCGRSLTGATSNGKDPKGSGGHFDLIAQRSDRRQGGNWLSVHAQRILDEIPEL